MKHRRTMTDKDLISIGPLNDSGDLKIMINVEINVRVFILQSIYF